MNESTANKHGADTVPFPPALFEALVDNEKNADQVEFESLEAEIEAIRKRIDELMGET